MNDSSIFLMRLGAISVVGGGAGAWLLIATPSPVFARLVPVLIFCVLPALGIVTTAPAAILLMRTFSQSAGGR